MTTALVIQFPGATQTDIHKIRNFGEDLFRAFQDNGWGEIALDKVDRATDRLVVTASLGKKVRRAEALIEKIMAEHYLDQIGTLVRETTD